MARKTPGRAGMGFGDRGSVSAVQSVPLGEPVTLFPAWEPRFSPLCSGNHSASHRVRDGGIWLTVGAQRMLTSPLPLG